MKQKVETKIQVHGMHCEHCAKSVQNVIMSLDNVQKVKVNVAGDVTIISNGEIDKVALTRAIDELGYEIEF